MNADVDKISEQCDLRQLESLLQNITYANLDRDDMVPHVYIKLPRVPHSNLGSSI
jgi:hypothetical protein